MDSSRIPKSAPGYTSNLMFDIAFPRQAFSSDWRRSLFSHKGTIAMLLKIDSTQPHRTRTSDRFVAYDKIFEFIAKAKNASIKVDLVTLEGKGHGDDAVYAFFESLEACEAHAPQPASGAM